MRGGGGGEKLEIECFHCDANMCTKIVTLCITPGASQDAKFYINFLSKDRQRKLCELPLDIYIFLVLCARVFFFVLFVCDLWQENIFLSIFHSPPVGAAENLKVANID